MIRSASPVREQAAPTATPALETSAFGRDLLRAFSVRPREISPKYFYDAEGSRLFDRICDLPEYYPTRCEREVLGRHAGDIAGELGADVEIVEFGAGSCEKVRLLLDALQRPRRFRPIDISAEHLDAAAAGLRRDYPGLDVQPMAADYTRRLLLPAPEPGVRRVGFFPGSTIGNFTPREALAFMRMAAQVLRGGGLLLGADLVKAPEVLHAAYNDSQGVTAAFNLNLLARANRELGTRFDLEAFDHAAFYNAPLQRIEMHLASRREQEVTLGERRFTLREGETLHTENSHKFTPERLRLLAMRAGFRPGPIWFDRRRWFCVQWMMS
ncbi:L-histidine N(alpha)-methyltransferase [Ramlibacter sp. AW1]|uniref:L-histidine N(Alpha)-methyltransferase n=1 Tax=Ramlibacter aurantiacus TaxID=2801330 RepID=A0A936ZLQ2_9BURK|nr:L-histidine N(alpha)-methyltransferase [Ramlibacter aurantiacus]MBL0420001.1 L-histidine N(alpha)-methyltransferase [Ramlibacter aurantiacus]